MDWNINLVITDITVSECISRANAIAADYESRLHKFTFSKTQSEQKDCCTTCWILADSVSLITTSTSTLPCTEYWELGANHEADNQPRQFHQTRLKPEA